MLLLLLTASCSFVPPGVAPHAARQVSSRVRMKEDDDGPKLPEFTLPKFEGIKPPWNTDWMDALRSDQTKAAAAAGATRGAAATLSNADLSFTDTDGDSIALKKATGGRVDFYVNGKLKMEAAVVAAKGSSLELQGIDANDWKYKFNANFKTYITDRLTPSDPADVEKALALVS